MHAQSSSCSPTPSPGRRGCVNSLPIQTIAFDARYVCDRFHGIGRHAYGLLEALSRLDTGRRYLVYFDPSAPNHRFDFGTLAARTNVDLRPIQLPLYLPTEQLIWPMLLRRERVSIFHSPYVFLPLLGRGARVMTVHDLIFERFPQYMPRRWWYLVYRTVTALGILRSAAVLTVSHASRVDLQRYYPSARNKVHVIGNAVDPRFRRVVDPPQLDRTRRRYRLPERFILTVGAGRPHKNVAAVVEALAHLDASVAPTLVVAGERDHRFPENLAERIQALDLGNRVLQTGAIHEADLPALYSLAEAFVFPSLVEGFGLPPLEAMACGTPVVASTAPAVAEVVGDAALTVDARDPRQLAGALQRVLYDAGLRTEFSRRGVARARAFSWDQVARATLKAYAAALERGGERRNEDHDGT